MTDVGLRRLIIWSARLADLWEPSQVALWFYSPQKPFDGLKPIDMLDSREKYEKFDRTMRAVLDGVHS